MDIFLARITKFLEKGERENMKHVGINELPEMNSHQIYRHSLVR